MKTMEVYLIKNMPGREFTYALRSLDDVECYISWKYKKELNKRPLVEIIVIEAQDLNMLGNIVKQMSRFIYKIESPSAEYLNSLLNRGGDNG